MHHLVPFAEANAGKVKAGYFPDNASRLLSTCGLILLAGCDFFDMWQLRTGCKHHDAMILRLFDCHGHALLQRQGTQFQGEIIIHLH
jgi:hypothetical protein